MRIVNVSTVREWQSQHGDAHTALANWYKVGRKAKWTSLHDVRATYQHADQVDCCLIFNICGNNYRLIARVRYADANHGGTLFLKAFLTHTEYDQNAWRKDCE